MWRFAVGQKLTATVSVQGLTKGEQVEVTHVHTWSTFFGDFTTLTVRTGAGTELKVKNGHLVLVAVCPGCRCCCHDLGCGKPHGNHDHGKLVDYTTTAVIRSATKAERDASVEAARRDGGAGVIAVDGHSCYVED